MEKRISVNARVDVRHLAAIGIFLEAQGSKPRNRSDLLHQAVSLLHEILIANGSIERIEDVRHAIRALDKMGLEWGDGSRGHRKIASALMTAEGEVLSKVLNTGEMSEEQIAKLEAEILKSLEES